VSNTGVKHVSYYAGRYNIVKNIDGKNIRFGGFPTVEEAEKHVRYCEEHNWSMDCIRKKNNSTSERKYIASLPNGSYQVGKNFGSKRISYGVFKSLEEAQKHRDFCVAHDWSSDCRRIRFPHNNLLPKYISKSRDRYVVQKCEGNDVKVRCSFTNLEDALLERDLLIECNWDEERLWELDEARGTL